MRNFLFKTLELITRYPRYHPEEYEIDKKLHWSKKIWTSNLFRLQEYLFGRKFGIRAEVSTHFEEINGIYYIRYELYSFEALLAYIEIIIRNYLQINLDWLRTPQFQIVPKPVYLTYIILGSLFTIKTKSNFLPLFGLAIAEDAISSSGVKTLVSSITIAHTSTGSNLLLVVGASISDSTTVPTVNSVSGITYNAVSLTQIDAQINNSQLYSSLYYLINPSTGTNNVVVTLATTYNRSCCGEISFSGANQSSQPDAHNNFTGTIQNPSNSITTISNGSMVVDNITIGGSVTISGVGASQSLIDNTALSTSGSGRSWTTIAISPAGTQSMSWTTSASRAYVQCIASFSPVIISTSTYQSFLQLLGIG